MAEDVLGTAIVELKARYDELAKDLDKARSDAEAALKGIEGTATLGVDTSEVTAGADSADAELEGIEGTAEVGVDTTDVDAGAAAADAMLDGIEGQATLGIDTSALDGAVSEAQAQLDSIEATATLGLDTSAIDTGLAQVEGGFGGLAGSAAAPGAILGGGLAEAAENGVGALGGVKGGIGALVGAAAGFVGIKTFGGFIADAREAREVSTLLGSQLRTTGADAWTSVESIEALAGSIQATTGISDEMVSHSAAWLTSFKNVRNEVGEGNDVFDRAIVSASDLSSVMGTDMQSATTQLGKALNDPIKGISALGRAGVQFTDEQKNMIAALVESGDLLGAQRIIMGELEGQIGGAAEAMADPWDRLSGSVGELSQSLGGALLPAMDAFATVAGPVVDFLAGLPAPIQLVVLAIPALVIGLAALGAVAPLVGTGLGLIGLGGGAASIGLSGLLIPLGLIVGAIALVVGAGYLLITHWDTLVGAGKAAWGGITGAIGAAVGWVRDNWPYLLGPIGVLIKHWDTLKAATGAAWDWITDRIGGFVDWVTAIPGRIGGVFAGMWEGIVGGAKAAFNALSSGWNSTIGAFGFTVPSWVPVLGGNRFDMPDMPRLAGGGTIRRSGFAMVGERGPEVRWLNRGEAISPIGDAGPAGGRGGGAPPVKVYARALLGTEADVLAWVEEGLRARGYGRGES
jgi:hypothetical protein